MGVDETAKLHRLKLSESYLCLGIGAIDATLIYHSLVMTNVDNTSFEDDTTLSP